MLSWELSNTLDTAFCLKGLDEALKQGKPAIFNSDEGFQSTSRDFTDRLRAEDIAIHMDRFTNL